MSEDRKRIVDRTEQSMVEAMRRMHESGEISHLYGRQLDLADDDPDWLVTRVLKQQGFSHPLLERAKDLDEPQRKADDLLNRLRRRRAWLADPASGSGTRAVQAFNEWRRDTLEEYRQTLVELNRGIRDYNLAVPTALHRPPVRVDRAVREAEEAILPLPLPQPAPEPPRRSLLRKRRRRT